MGAHYKAACKELLLAAVTHQPPAYPRPHRLHIDTRYGKRKVRASVLVALLKAMELTCPEKLTCSEPVPPPVYPKMASAETSPRSWLGLGQEDKASFAVGSAIPSSHIGTQPGHAQAPGQPWCYLQCGPPGTGGSRRCYWAPGQHKS